MLGDASDFTPLDLLGSLGLNAAATHFACQGQELRTGFAVEMDGKKEVQAFTDYRFLAGAASAIVAQFGPPMVRRVGHDMATGLLGSFVATETCRMAAKAKQKVITFQDVAGPVSQISEAAAQISEAARAVAPRAKGAKNYARGSMNTSYAW